MAEKEFSIGDVRAITMTELWRWLGSRIDAEGLRSPDLLESRIMSANFVIRHPHHQTAEKLSMHLGVCKREAPGFGRDVPTSIFAPEAFPPPFPF